MKGLYVFFNTASVRQCPSYYLKAFAATGFFLITLGSYAQQGQVSGRITNAVSGEALPGATVAVTGTSNGTSTGADGAYTLQLAPGNYRIRTGFVGYQSKTSTVTVTADQTITLDFGLEPGTAALNEVVVIGSRSATGRSNIETAVPVDVILPRDIVATGQVDITQVLNSVAPSFSSSRNSRSDGTDFVDPASLRGLSPDQVLVLVNGKRRHTSALVNVNGTQGRGSVGVDLNAIPVAAIQRIEVLRDGAAAQYGSDAIAGVINIVLKSDTVGITATSTYGKFQEGDGETVQADVNYGFKVGERGFFNLTGQINNRAATNRAGAYSRTNLLTELPNPLIYQNPTDEVREAAFDLSRTENIGSAKVNNAGLFFNSSFPLVGNAQVYAYGGISNRNSLSNGFFRYPRNNNQITESIYPNGFLPQINAVINDRSLTVGISGNKRGWDIDLSNTYGSNAVQYNVVNTLNASLGVSSPTNFYAGTILFRQNTTNLGLTRRFNEVGPLASVNVAFGAEYRLDNFEIQAGETSSYVLGTDSVRSAATGLATGAKAAGAQVFPGFQPGNALSKYRNNTALYAEIESDITPSLLVSVAGRYENYSDFGQKYTGKATARIKVVEDVSIRGAVSTGFRAPSLQQRFFTTTSTNFVNGVPLQLLTSNNESAVTRAFGVPSLQPETSFNLSAGFTARILRNVTATVDYYRVDIDNRVVLSGNLLKTSAPVVASLLAPYPDIVGARFFTNSVDTRTRGVDAVLSYRTEVGRGSLNLSAAANFTRTNIQTINVPSTLVSDNSSANLLSTLFFNRVEQGRFQRGTPLNKYVFTTTYTVGKLTAFARATRYGAYTSFATEDALDSVTGARDQTFTPKIVTDLTITYQLIKPIALSIGANNLFNVYPDKNIPANNTNGTNVYGGTNQFGFFGAYYFGRVILTF